MFAGGIIRSHNTSHCLIEVVTKAGFTVFIGGKWFCSKTCMLKGKEKDPPQKDDSKSKYIRALLYCGLMDLVRHDAVRENDGEAMMSHWRHDIVQFHNRHHPKYVLLGHRPLAGW